MRDEFVGTPVDLESRSRSANARVNKLGPARVGRSVSRLVQDPLLDSIEAVYRQRYSSFLRVATAIAGDEETGRDAVQDGFAGAVRSRHRYRREGSLEAWLWRAVVNAARTRRRTPSDAQPVADIAVTTDNGVSQSAVRDVLAALPERQRLVVFLRYFADLDYKTIARVAGVETGTVSATLSAAHDSLRARLKEELHA
jgi:RNA polymerase sigma factor (sigma-70 family)